MDLFSDLNTSRYIEDSSHARVFSLRMNDVRNIELFLDELMICVPEKLENDFSLRLKFTEVHDGMAFNIDRRNIRSRNLNRQRERNSRLIPNNVSP